VALTWKIRLLVEIKQKKTDYISGALTRDFLLSASFANARAIDPRAKLRNPRMSGDATKRVFELHAEKNSQLLIKTYAPEIRSKT